MEMYTCNEALSILPAQLSLAQLSIALDFALLRECVCIKNVCRQKLSISSQLNAQGPGQHNFYSAEYQQFS